MSSRLQVLVSDREMEEFQRLAKQEHATLGEWVRRTLKEAGASKPVIGPEAKLQAVRSAVECDFPAPDIDQMLAEVERGYLD